VTTPTDGPASEEPEVPAPDATSGSPVSPPPPPPPPVDPYAAAPGAGGYPPPPPSAYPPPPDGFPGATPGVYAAAAGAVSGPKQSGKAIASLVLGIVGFCICGIILGGLAVFLGLQARKEIAASNGAQSGDGLALAGVIIGGVALVLGIGQLIWFLGR
jgi:hypothetical protein